MKLRIAIYGSVTFCILLAYWMTLGDAPLLLDYLICPSCFSGDIVYWHYKVRMDIWFDEFYRLFHYSLIITIVYERFWHWFTNGFEIC